METAQFTIRNGKTAHFQVGTAGSYDKFDVSATPELVAHYNRMKAEGRTSNSLYGSTTQYAPADVQTKRTVSVKIESVFVAREE